MYAQNLCVFFCVNVGSEIRWGTKIKYAFLCKVLCEKNNKRIKKFKLSSLFLRANGFNDNNNSNKNILTYCTCKNKIKSSYVK